MKNRHYLNRAFLVSLTMWLLAGSPALAQGTAFTYQGKLSNNSAPANGTYDMQFKLFDALTGGNQVGAPVTNPAVAVENGVFTVQLDFGAGAFDSTPRFLEIEVRPSGDPNPYTVLAPRQAFSSIPYAMHSVNASAADGLSAACTSCVTNTQINSVDGTKISGAIPVTSVPQGSGNYIQNASASLKAGKRSLQEDASFDISGNGVIGGTLAIGTATPTDGTKLDVNGGPMRLTQTNNRVIQFGSPNSETGMTIKYNQQTPPLLARADVRFDGSTLKLVAVGGDFVPPNQNGIVIDTIGNVGVGTTNLTAGIKMEVNGVTRITPAANKAIQFGNPNTETGMTLQQNVGANRADVRFDGLTLKLVTGEGLPFSTNGIAIDIAGNVGIGTTSPAAKFHVVGTARTSVLEITGGSDLAEHFEVGDEVKPGMVVAIDSQQTGKLTLARGAYNRRVAGIISGANHLAAGMVLPNVKASSHSQPVALSGRVWVYCDASRHAIKPGDLLTTSATPGHAMKVTHYRRAQGAIIGKAMTELKSGRGLVLVLVSLQ